MVVETASVVTKIIMGLSKPFGHLARIINKI